MESIGVIASIAVLISFLATDEKQIRLLNILGAGLFVSYGITINSFSNIFLNGALIVIHVVRLIYLFRNEQKHL